MDGGGGSDAFGSSTAPLTWHDFLERMRHPSAADFVKSIKSFIVSFSNKAPDPERDSAAVQEFLAKMEGGFRAHSLWAGSSEEELESAGEGLEKYVMTKLFNRAFASLPEDVKRDEELFEKMALLQQFVRPENLDITPTFQNEPSWLLAQKELQKINMYKAPRDKLVCILNCCKVINNLLLNASIASNDNPPGADEFLPVLIFVTIKANPPELHSNLLYIQRYRRQSRLVSEAAYYFTNMLSAESFIWSVEAHSLSMDETEFEKRMESARAHLLGRSTNTEDLRDQSNQDMISSRKETSESKRESSEHYGTPQPITKSQPISNVEKKGAADILKEDQMDKYIQEYPFLFANAGDLTVDDVENLLHSYKVVVLKYVSLCKGMGVSSTSLPQTNTEVQAKTDTIKESEDATEVVASRETDEGVRGNDDSNDNLFSGMEMGISSTSLPQTNTEVQVKTDTIKESKDATEVVASSETDEGVKENDDSNDNFFSGMDYVESKLTTEEPVAQLTTQMGEGPG